MRAVRLFAKWEPKDDYRPTPKDIINRSTYLGSKVWRYPEVKVVDMPVPRIEEKDDVIIKVKACGICGSDVHMAQSDDDGYIYYPGLTAFPVTIGHEFSGEVVEAGEYAINRRTGVRFSKGEAVCSEEMAWCGECRPCADGFPNHCERLQEIGFSIDGAFAEFIKVKSKYIWSLEGLRERFEGDRVFLAGSLVEPCSVAYNAVIERGGGIRPGDSVWILGGGPIGIAACAILNHAGAKNVILSEPSRGRGEIGISLGATHLLDPKEVNCAEEVLRITDGDGVNLILEATGLFDIVWPDIERVIWEGKAVNCTVVLVARADKKIPLTAEVFQVRRANIVGSQGHSGHGNFPRVIASMARWLDPTMMITKRIRLEDIPENLRLLQSDRENCKITMVL